MTPGRTGTVEADGSTPANLNLRIPHSIKHRLEHTARERQLPQSIVVRQALDAALLHLPSESAAPTPVA